MKIIVDNIGERGTAINKIELMSAIPKEYYEVLKNIEGIWETNIPPHSTRHINHHYTIEDYKNKIKVTDNISGQLKISWMHKKSGQILDFTSHI